jgi:hypothetical protein
MSAAVEVSAELDTWNAAGRRIREEIPCTGKDGRATDKDCKRRDDAVRAQLAEWGVELDGLRHVWHTTVMEDGTVCGVWSDSVTHAAVTQALWWSGDVVRIMEDPDSREHTRLKAAQKADRKRREELYWKYDADQPVPTGGLLDLL